MSWFDSIVDTGTKAFQWMEDNPNATSFIGGAAMGALKYADIRAQQKEAAKVRQEQRDYRSTFGGASTTDAGFTPADLTGGEGSLVGGATGVASMADQF